MQRRNSPYNLHLIISESFADDELIIIPEGATVKPLDTQPKPAEEIEWTAEDDAIMNKIMEKARRLGLKADPVKPVKKVVQREKKQHE